MPYLGHVKLTVFGMVGSADNATGDIWQITMNFGNEGAAYVAADTTLSQLAEAGVSAVGDMLSGAHAASYSKVFGVEGAKAVNIGSDGKYAAADAALGVSGNAVTFMDDQVERGQGACIPGQLAIVCSLGTGVRGKSARGRIYFPAGPLSVDNPDDPFMSAASQAGYLADFKTCLSTIEGLSGAHLIVASSKGTNHVVNTLRVGRVVDTQRRRRNAIDEAYVSATYPQ